VMKNDTKFVIQAASQAQAASDYILQLANVEIAAWHENQHGSGPPDLEPVSLHPDLAATAPEPVAFSFKNENQFIVEKYLITKCFN